MSSRDPDDDTIAAYLLGTLPETERSRLEEEFFRDDQAFERILAVEDDLLHDYAAGALSDDERRRLEGRLLSTESGQRRLTRARALLAALGSEAAPRRTPLRAWWPAAAAVLLTFGVGALFFLKSPGQERVAAVPPSRTPVPAPSPASSLSPEARPSPRPVGSVVALALAPGLTRAGGGPLRVVLPATASALRLVLTLPPGVGASRYRAALLTPEGTEQWSTGSLARSAGTLSLDVPARQVPEGDYELVLSTDGALPEEVASYTFGVLRRP